MCAWDLRIPQNDQCIVAIIFRAVRRGDALEHVCCCRDGLWRAYGSAVSHGLCTEPPPPPVTRSPATQCPPGQKELGRPRGSWAWGKGRTREITGQGRPRSPKTVQSAEEGEGKDKRQRIIVVVRSPCQEHYSADAHPSAHKSVLESANPRIGVHLDAPGQRYGQQPPRPPPLPPSHPDFIVGKKYNLQKEILIRAIFSTQTFGVQIPPPFSPFL